MNTRVFRTKVFLRGVAALALAFAGITGVEAGPASNPALFAAVRAPAPSSIEVTNADVDASNRKIAMAHSALAQMWTKHFRDLGSRFDVPGLVRYRGGALSACGPMRQNNAGYCPGDNTIYFDEVFVASQAKAAARQLGTDGDMAGIGIIAHEMGHAVAIQLGVRSASNYDNEALADCLAGAFADESKQDGNLEKGDIEEAFFGMAAAGDPTPQLTGNSRMDRRILRMVSLHAHGTREQRTANFQHGLAGGAGACIGVFRS
jgi:predicted metalloprotease